MWLALALALLFQAQGGTSNVTPGSVDGVSESVLHRFILGSGLIDIVHTIVN